MKHVGMTDSIVRAVQSEVWLHSSDEWMSLNVTRIRSFKLIIQPPTPIFWSDIENRTWSTPDHHIQGSNGHKKPGKVMEF